MIELTTHEGIPDGAARADWEILVNEAYDVDLNEGAGHAGRSAVIDLIARKPA